MLGAITLIIDKLLCSTKYLVSIVLLMVLETFQVILPPTRTSKI